MSLFGKRSSIVIAWLGLAVSSRGTTPGLNNIPTADTTSQGAFVLQAYGTVGGEADDDFNLGFKTGIDLGRLDMEFGADSNISPSDAGPVTAQAKLALPLGDNLPTIAIGSANTTFSSADANRAGETFGYLVVSQDLCSLRGHIDWGLQDDELLPFLGFDKTFTRESFGIGGDDRDLLTLRTDMIQQRDSSWLYSLGAISFHWARLMDKENTHKFKPFAEVKAELEAAGITPDKSIMCYCGTSREGSLLRFYLKFVAIPTCVFMKALGRNTSG